MLKKQKLSIVIPGMLMILSGSVYAIERDHAVMQHDSGYMDHTAMKQDNGHMDHTTMQHENMPGDSSVMNSDDAHAGHQAKMTHDDASLEADHISEEDALAMLDSVPASGKSREAGYDGRYAMEATRHDDDISAQCSKASRGLVMLDNATWAKCGGKVAGTSVGRSGKPAVSGHDSHSQH